MEYLALFLYLCGCWGQYLLLEGDSETEDPTDWSRSAPLIVLWFIVMPITFITFIGFHIANLFNKGEKTR